MFTSEWIAGCFLVAHLLVCHLNYPLAIHRQAPHGKEAFLCFVNAVANGFLLGTKAQAHIASGLGLENVVVGDGATDAELLP